LALSRSVFALPSSCACIWTGLDLGIDKSHYRSLRDEQCGNISGGDPYDGAMAGGTQAEEGNRPRQQRGQGHRVSRGGSGGGRGRGHEGNPASADGGQEGSSNADVKGGHMHL